MILFQDHYLAKDMQIQYGSTHSLTTHLDSIEVLSTIDEAVFTPPSNAIPQNVEVRKIKIVSAPLDATIAATPAAASTEVPPAGAKPDASEELMLLAAKTNNLTGDDVKPWHLKASYTMLDENGKTTDQGSYEEFYVSPTKFKRSFTGTNYKYSEYGTNTGVMFSGDQNKQFSRANELHSEFLTPLPSPQLIAQRSYFSKQLEAGGVKFTCVSLKDSNGNPYGPNWCFDADTPLLRVTTPYHGARCIHNGIVSFQGRSIAGDLKFIQQDKSSLTAHLDSIEAITSIDEALFLPPADAAPLKNAVVRIDPPKKINLAGGVMAGNLINAVRPDYPPIAKAARIQGTVVLQGTISKEGYVINLRVISGPPMLQQAAMDAVKHWIYKPYRLSGQPVEVMTTINVIFTLGG
jgi:TonB family protein